MKRTAKLVFCLLALCMMVFSGPTCTVNAVKAGFDAQNYTATNPVTVDGKWTNPNEWVDAAQYSLTGGLVGYWKCKWAAAEDYSWIYQYYLVEFLSDTTNNAGDYFQICMQLPPEMNVNPVGGTAPQTSCYMFIYSGHNRATGLKAYVGNGTGWAATAAWTIPAMLDANDSLTASPLSATPHWVCEFKVDHLTIAVYPPQGILVGAYDASNSGSGLQTWPTASGPNVPNDWGLMTALFEPIPEGIGIAVVALLSSFAIVVSTRSLRRRTPNTKS